MDFFKLKLEKFPNEEDFGLKTSVGHTEVIIFLAKAMDNLGLFFQYCNDLPLKFKIDWF